MSLSSFKPVMRAAIILVLAAVLLLLIRVPLSWSDQAIFGALIVVASMAVGRSNNSRYITSILTLVSLYCSFRYIVWRWWSSLSYLNNSGWAVDWFGLLFALLLLVAESYSVFVLVLGYFQSARPLKRRPVPMPEDISLWPTVDVFVPTYNEPLDVVRPTVLAAMAIDWPTDRVKVYILDDGRRPEFREFAEECGCGYLIRSDNKHAKAGNINAALKVTSGDYIAIFDCDHIATRSFLQMTMGWFQHDSKLAMVQTPHHFYSPDPFERNLDVFRKIPNEGALFYGVVQDGNDLWNATFFCGSCAVIKREALSQIGGIAVETVTEDAHTALRLQRLGWNTAYIGIPQAAGLATGSLAAHVGQRIRWARGMVQILRTECPLFASGLKFSQRICYLNCVLHYLYAIPRLTFICAPLVYLLFGRSNLYGYIWEILAYAAPHLILSNLVNSRTQGNHRHSFWNEVYEIILAPYILLPTTFALINPKWGKFNVTAKSSVVDQDFFDWQIARPYLFLLLLNIVGIAMAVPRYFTSGDPSGVLVINVVWATINSLMIGACLAVSFETKQRRSTARVEANLPAKLQLDSMEEILCTVIDLSEGGLALRGEEAFPKDAGLRGSVQIRGGSETFHFPVQTVRSIDNRIHLRFTENSLQHQRNVTKLVYVRADSWLDWNKDQRRDRILSSLLQVLSVGAHGIWIVPSLLSRSRKPEQKSGSALPSTAGLIILAALLLGSSLKGAETTEFHDRQTLRSLGLKQALSVGESHRDASFQFAVPGSKVVDSALLNLTVPTSSRIGSPELKVSLNGVPVDAQITPADKAVAISLPADVLVSENTLSFSLKGKGSLTIDPNSELITSGTALILPSRLSLLPAPFFDMAGQQRLNLAFVFDGAPDLSTLKAAGMVSSWFGALASYRGTHSSVFTADIPAGNAVLFATAGSLLARKLGIETTDAGISICDNPNDRFGRILAFVAPDSESLPQLANALISSPGRPETSTWHPSADLLTKASSQPATPPALWSDSRSPIQLMAGVPEGMRHARPGMPGNIYFQLAPDLEWGTRLTVPLRLSFQLSGLSGSDHIWVAVRLNNTFVSKREISAAESVRPIAQSFAISTSLLYSSNTLSVELLNSPDSAASLNTDGVDLQLLPGTQLNLGNPAHFVQMPRLDLFAASAFPFSGRSDLGSTAVLLPSAPTSGQLGIYLDVLSFLGAHTGVAGTDFVVGYPNNLRVAAEKNIIAIASAENNEAARPFVDSAVLFPAAGQFQPGNLTLSGLEWFSRAPLERRDDLSKLEAHLAHESAISFVMEQFVSPFHANRSVLLLATRNSGDDAPYFDQIRKSSEQGDIRGGLSTLDGDRFTSFALAPRTYTIGEKFSLAFIYNWLRFHLWILPVGIIAIAGLIARWWEELLQRQAERRLHIA